MSAGRDTVEWSGDRIRVLRDGVLVGAGRYRDGRIIDRSLDALGGEAAWAALEEQLRTDGEAFVASAQQSAYDERGVDVTQIDRMLALTPAERLEVLDGERRSMAKLVGDAPRD